MMLCWSERTINRTRTERRSWLIRRQQWGILDNGRNPDPAISQGWWQL